MRAAPFVVSRGAVIELITSTLSVLLVLRKQHCVTVLHTVSGHTRDNNAAGQLSCMMGAASVTAAHPRSCAEAASGASGFALSFASPLRFM